MRSSRGCAAESFPAGCGDDPGGAPPWTIWHPTAESSEPEPPQPAEEHGTLEPQQAGDEQTQREAETDSLTFEQHLLAAAVKPGHAALTSALHGGEAPTIRCLPPIVVPKPGGLSREREFLALLDDEVDDEQL